MDNLTQFILLTARQLLKVHALTFDPFLAKENFTGLHIRDSFKGNIGQPHVAIGEYGQGVRSLVDLMTIVHVIEGETAHTDGIELVL